MRNEASFEHTPYQSKRLGDLNEALEGYAIEFAAALDKNNQFLAEVCFDQMLDTVLMRYVQDTRQTKVPVHKKRFPNRQALVRHAQQELEELLDRISPAGARQVSAQMARCESMLFPRGRGKVRFNVDPDWLISEVATGVHPTWESIK